MYKEFAKFRLAAIACAALSSYAAASVTIAAPAARAQGWDAALPSPAIVSLDLDDITPSESATAQNDIRGSLQGDDATGDDVTGNAASNNDASGNTVNGNAAIDNAEIDDALARALREEPLPQGPVKSLARPNTPHAPSTTPQWSRNMSGNGTTQYSVAKPLVPNTVGTDWNVSVGGDVSMPAGQSTVYAPGKPLPGASNDSIGRGGAWAKVGVPDVGDVRVRIDPSLDGSTVAAGLQRTVPLGAKYTLTLGGTQSYTDPLGARLGTVVPNATQVWARETSAMLDILSTGTSLGTSSSYSTLDNVGHQSFSARQKIYGPLQVAATVTDPGKTTSSKSLTANFRFDW